MPISARSQTEVFSHFARIRTSLATRFLLAASVAILVACQVATHEVRDLSRDEYLGNPPAGAVLLDVRTLQEYETGHIEGAVHIPHDQLVARLGELESARNAPVIVYCESGRRAGMAASDLVTAGFSNVLHLDGDMKAWRADSLPIVRSE